MAENTTLLPNEGMKNVTTYVQNSSQLAITIGAFFDENFVRVSILHTEDKTCPLTS
jgi:hypothetical protein